MMTPDKELEISEQIMFVDSEYCDDVSICVDVPYSDYWHGSQNIEVDIDEDLAKDIIDFLKNSFNIE